MNILKVQNDSEPIRFEWVGEEDGFQVMYGRSALGERFEVSDLRKRIEPWLASLFQSEHLSLLVGSGLTHAVHTIATGKQAAGMDITTLSVYHDEILAHAQITARKAGREKVNFEDQLRTANELLRGLVILERSKDAERLSSDLERIMRDFAQSILSGETGIVTANDERREEAFNTLVTFLMSFASRSGPRDRLNIFTTNYDRLIEAGAELAGLHLLDRFVGNLMPVFRSSRLDVDLHYNPPGIRGEPRYLEGVARFVKLHGSVDWVQVGQDIRRIGLPFGAEDVEPYLKAPGLEQTTPYKLMIYPNAAKDRETADYPYVELFRDFAATICRPNSTLVTYGYSFGDDHINRVIRDMLSIPSTHLVVISRSDSLGRIMAHYEELGRVSQTSLLIGPDIADLQKLTESYLPKPAIDKSMARMGRLLQQRFFTQPPVVDGEQGADTEVES